MTLPADTAYYFLMKETKPGKSYNQTKQRIHRNKNLHRCFVVQDALQPELHERFFIAFLPGLRSESAFKYGQGAYHTNPSLRCNYSNNTQVEILNLQLHIQSHPQYALRIIRTCPNTTKTANRGCRSRIPSAIL